MGGYAPPFLLTLAIAVIMTYSYLERLALHSEFVPCGNCGNSEQMYQLTYDGIPVATPFGLTINMCRRCGAMTLSYPNAVDEHSIVLLPANWIDMIEVIPF